MNAGRAVLVAVGCAVLAALFANHVFAVPVGWAVVLGLPVAAIALPAALLSGAADANWEPVPGPADIAGELQASMLAARLAEAAEDQRRFVTRLQPRLRRLALAVLRTRPGAADLTTVDDPRARAALGPELHRVLTDKDARLPEPRRLAELLARLETP
ncbi:MAG TPA: hypothetical protein VGX25_07080 [Actinophytocola sp.]|uniref:hypothetical protein n=1 Tax=Actinophytocola sp. TaxID=1872138 RepID=UPI002DDD8B31|nr:hypothetical protein [Actinophytocola sp.]HEV2779153.1 hypothetical protein [Actinophytocola sp.]